jgi:universal stress protein E
MERFTAITVGVDLGDPGTDALQQAARLAAKRGATLHAVHVVEELVVVDLAKSLGQEIAATRADVVRDAEAELARRCADLAMPGSSRRRVEIGLPWRELLAVVEETASGLLVLGLGEDRRGRRGAGAMAGQCVRRSRCPTLLVAPGWFGPTRHVVVGIDFSPSSAGALTEALALARVDGAQVEAVHVFAGPWRRLHYRAPTPQASPKYRRAFHRALRARLESFVAATAAECGLPPPECRLVEADSDGRGLAAHAVRSAADLLAVGTHGRSGWREMLLGTTAERLLADTKLSLLTVPPPIGGPVSRGTVD